MTTKRGRPTAQQPKTAYDVRRYLTLVMALAYSNNRNHISALCKLWGVEPQSDTMATLRSLAWHVIEYHGTVQWEENDTTYGVTACEDDDA